MPWDVKKVKDEWCVFKAGTNEKMGCHDSEAKAKAQQRALYANAASERTTLSFGDSRRRLVSTFALSDSIEPGQATWVHAAKMGEWNHPVYGTVTFDDYVMSQFKSNFDSKVYGQDLPISFEHFGMDPAKGHKAAGWVKDMEIRDDGVWYSVEFTPEAASEVNDGAWKYFSIEWQDVWNDPETDHPYIYVAQGGALTNNPFLKGMVPLNFSELMAERSEHADKEHSEPGTGGGGEPEPRPQPEPDPAADEGWRRDTPPIEQEGRSDSVNPEEIVAAIRKSLGLGDDADIVTSITELHTQNTEMNAELEPLRKAASEADRGKSFREEYPEEYERMALLEESNRDSKARAFSGSYEKFQQVKLETDEKGNETRIVTPTKKGFAAITLQKIEEVHKKFSQRAATVQDFQAVLDSIAETGIVDYSEVGSSLDGGSKQFGERTVEVREGQLAFTAIVQDIMEKDNMDARAATRAARVQFPTEYDEYRNSIPTPNR